LNFNHLSLVLHPSGELAQLVEYLHGMQGVSFLKTLCQSSL